MRADRSKCRCWRPASSQKMSNSRGSQKLVDEGFRKGFKGRRASTLWCSMSIQWGVRTSSGAMEEMSRKVQNVRAHITLRTSKDQSELPAGRVAWEEDDEVHYGTMEERSGKVQNMRALTS